MSKIIDHNLISDLKSLGFSSHEVDVYLDLIMTGEKSAIRISENVKLHKQFVYNALEILREKGMVVRIGEMRAKWKASNPRQIITLVEEKENRAASAVRALLPLLSSGPAQDFIITEGVKAFQSSIIDIIKRIPNDSTILMICGEWDKYFERAGQRIHNEWDRIRLLKKIKFRIIGPRSLSRSMSESAAKRGLIDYRTMDGLERNLVNTSIYDKMVIFDIYGDPHLSFCINNQKVTDSQRDFFEALWLSAI